MLSERMRHNLADFQLKAMNKTHRAILTISGGKLLRSAFTMPVVELETTGRKSGQVRKTMLTSPVQDGDEIVLVASKGGDDRDPDWYQNLVKTPDVALSIHGKRQEMTARTATAGEKEKLWPQIVERYKGYAGYQTKTDRDIPVVILTPR